MIFRVFICAALLACSLPAHADDIDELINFSKRRDEALVVKAVRCDVVVLENGQRVKLIGVESPGDPPRRYTRYDEHGKPIEPSPQEELIIPIEEQALAYAKNLLEGKKVKLEYDLDALSPDGYRYAYIYLPDGHMANAELLRMGFVRLSIVPPNIKHAQELREAYQEARREKRGLESE